MSTPVQHPHVANTGEFSGFLTPDEAGPIFDEVAKTSVVQQVARRIPFGPSGVAIPHFVGDIQASWTAEGGKKPITKGGMERKIVKPEKITAIFAESAEVVRANPGNYLNIMREKVAEAFALAFDAAALAGTNTPFGTYIGQTTTAVSLVDGDQGTAGEQGNTYLQLNAALAALVNDGKKLTGVLFDDVAEPILNGAVDGQGRPLFIDSPITETSAAFRGGRVLGRPAYLSDHVATGSVVGYAGDWSQVVWGQVGGISYDVSDQATLDLSEAQDGTGLTSLWQHNLVAVRVEAEYGLLVNDPESFVKLTTDVDTAVV